jgi:hypothetical protein
MAKRSWSELTDSQKAGVIIAGALQLGLLAAALWDLAHRKPEEVRGDRRLWAGLVFINWIGPLAYFTIGRKESLFSLRCLLGERVTSTQESEEA